MATTTTPNAPLGKDMEEWDEFLQGRYQEGKSEEEFRQYDEHANPGVAEFYRLNHQHQTFDYVMAKEKEYFGLNKGMKTIWEARTPFDRSVVNVSRFSLWLRRTSSSRPGS